MEDWDESGDHVPASLNCGHVFGQSCLSRWMKTSRTCPTCKAKCAKKDVRKLYLPRASGAEANLETSALLSKSQAELNEARKALEVARASLAFVAYCDTAEPDVVDIPSPNSSQEPLVFRQRSETGNLSFTTSHENSTGPPIFGIHATIPLLSGYCADYIPSKDWLLLSCSNATRTVDPVTALKFSPSPVRLGSIDEPMKSDGIAIVTSWDSLDRYYTFIPLHDKPVRCITVSPFDSSLVMTSSLDGTACIINIETNQLVTRFHKLPNPAPIWACCWDASNRNVVYLASGSDVHIFNLNHPSKPTATLHMTSSPNLATFGPRSPADKIFSLISLDPGKSTEAGARPAPRLLVGTSWGIFLWEFGGPPQICDLSTHLCFAATHHAPVAWHALAQRGDSNCFLSTFTQGDRQTQLVFGLGEVATAIPYFEIELTLTEPPNGTSASCIVDIQGVNVIGSYSPVHKVSTLLAPLSQRNNSSLLDAGERLLLKHTTAWKPIFANHDHNVYIVACSPSAARILTTHKE